MNDRSSVSHDCSSKSSQRLVMAISRYSLGTTMQCTNYSMTSMGATNRFCGTVMPSVLAPKPQLVAPRSDWRSLNGLDRNDARHRLDRACDLRRNGEAPGQPDFDFGSA